MPIISGGSGGGFVPAIGVVRITSGNLTTASLTFVDLTGVTVTITTGARRVLLIFTGFGNSNGTGEVALDFAVDGTRVGGTAGLIEVGAGTNIDRNFCFSFLTDVLTAGSHTFKVQWLVSANTGTIFASATAPAVLQAIEQGA